MFSFVFASSVYLSTSFITSFKNSFFNDVCNSFIFNNGVAIKANENDASLLKLSTIILSFLFLYYR